MTVRRNMESIDKQIKVSLKSTNLPDLMFRMSTNSDKFVFEKLCYWNVELDRGQSFENVVITFLFFIGQDVKFRLEHSPDVAKPVPAGQTGSKSASCSYLCDVVLCK